MSLVIGYDFHQNPDLVLWNVYNDYNYGVRIAKMYEPVMTDIKHC